MKLRCARQRGADSEASGSFGKQCPAESSFRRQYPPNFTRHLKMTDEAFHKDPAARAQERAIISNTSKYTKSLDLPTRSPPSLRETIFQHLNATPLKRKSLDGGLDCVAAFFPRAAVKMYLSNGLGQRPRLSVERHRPGRRRSS